jgi:hypothetical protein
MPSGNIPELGQPAVLCAVGGSTLAGAFIPWGITEGPDGAPWFTMSDYSPEYSAIGRITTGGKVSVWRH